jgi:hypothetical protein
MAARKEEPLAAYEESTGRTKRGIAHSSTVSLEKQERHSSTSKRPIDQPRLLAGFFFYWRKERLPAALRERGTLTLSASRPRERPWAASSFALARRSRALTRLLSGGRRAY